MIGADPDAEVIALSPKTLLATNRFLCEICGKGFQRDQNLQLHRRGHNLPWKLRQRSGKEPRKRVYVCPEKSCVHHNPARALGDLTGIKKHFCRKHGEKKWKCDKCSKRYAVQSDWKAHSKTCGTREYRCDCGTLFSRRDSFITHRAFCDALAEETARVSAAANIANTANFLFTGGCLIGSDMLHPLSSNNLKLNTSNSDHQGNNNNNNNDEQCRNNGLSLWMGHGLTHTTEPLSANTATTLNDMHHMNPMSAHATLYTDDLFTNTASNGQLHLDHNQLSWLYSGGNKVSSNASTGEFTNTLKEIETPQSLLTSIPSLFSNQHRSTSAPVSDMSATALLQKAAQMGVTSSATTPFMVGSFESKSNGTHEALDQECNKLGENHHCLFGSNSNPSSNLESIMNGFAGSSPFEMFTAATMRRHVSLKDDIGGGGETRDFLGVGSVQTLCPPSINGWI
ncbi:Zinc finger protein MAGPIE [Ananas comosus]|uniref:Protein EARLY HEADING DATE 2 n=1 Tax=Ananas comosus TaxID=4615 RepID=A0A199W4L9_ANACO|nr:Zinc finger protein MAGPIE [Ananas comosus]